MISAQWITNRHGTKYRYYRCSKKRGRCSQSYLQEKDLAEQIKARLQTISLCDRYTDWMLEQVKEWERKETRASQSEVQNLATKIKYGEARLEKLISTYLDGDIPKELYLKQKDEIMRSLAALKAEIKDFERGGNKWVEPLREWILDTKQADFLANNPDFHKMKLLVQKIGTNPTVRDKSARFGAPVSSEFVAKRRRFLPHSAPAARLSGFLSEAEVTFGGESGIRTHGAVARTTVFETVQFNHSCISPQVQRRSWKKD